MKVAEAFSKSLFWDVDPEKLDWEKSRQLIIQRVLVRGGMKDMRTIFKIYSREQIREVIRNSRDLDNITHNFCSNYFNIPKEQMHAPSQYY